MPPRTSLVSGPLIKVNGADLAATIEDSIIDLRVSQSLGLPSQLTIRISDHDFTIGDGDRFVIGNEVKVQFADDKGSPVTVFEGEIVSVGIEQTADRFDGSELVVTAYDSSHRLRHATKIRTFQKQKYSDIVTMIATEGGLRSRVDDTKVTFDYLIQTTSNFDFLNELAFRTGSDWWVEEKTLNFRPRATTAPIVVTYGEDVRRLKTRFTATNEFKSVTVSAWDPLSKRKIVGKATPQAAGQNANSDLATGGRTKAKAFAGDRTVSSLVGTSNDEMTQLAASLAARFDGNGVSARCECIGNPLIRAGSMVKIDNAGTRVSGTYFVASCEHHFSRSQNHVTTFTTGGLDRASIVDMLGAGGSGGTPAVNPFGSAGLTIGIVTNNKDPDGIGRVRVKFPALSDNEESWWARVATPGGGSQAGLMMMPQIDDEVVVGFEGGDLRRPFVLGGLWGAKAKPPTASEVFLANNKVVEWGMRTMNGSTLAMRSGDQPADKHFKVKLPDGTLLYLGSDKVEIVAQNKSIELKSGQASVLITDKGDIKLRGANVSIDAQQGVTINGLTFSAKGNTTAKVEGGTAIEVKGGASATLEASGITEVKGSLVKIN